MKWLLIHLNFNGCCYITKMDVALSQFYLWMFLHHTSETDIFTWNSMVVSTRHKWDVLTSHSWMDVFTRHNGRCYWPLEQKRALPSKSGNCVTELYAIEGETTLSEEIQF